MARKLLIETLNNAGDIKGTDKWAPITDIDGFIDQIKTMEGDEKASIEQFNTLVSGVPSPWARAKLTTYALTNNSSPDDNRALIECYRQMRSEWRGLIAAYVLYSDRFQISEPIALSQKAITETHGSFDIRNVLGSMLFNELPLWRHSSDVDDKNAPAKIQLLYYTDQNNQRTLVGATSPYTIFFTATNYSLATAKGDDDIYWIDAGGNFTDPTEQFRNRQGANDMNNISKLVSFLNKMNSKREDYKEELLKICGEKFRGQITGMVQGIGSFINAWLNDIKAVNPAWGNSDNLVPVTINEYAKPALPVAKLFDFKNTYYWYDKAFYLKTDKQGAIEIQDAQSLFIDSKYVFGFKTTEEDAGKFEDAPVTYVKARDKNSDSVFFCALPFSRFAISIMDSEIMNVINGEQGSGNVHLTASVNNNILKVVLRAKINEVWMDVIAKEFEIVVPASIGHVFTWPNFASRLWTRYYYFSEYPTNGSGIRILPVFKSIPAAGSNETEEIDFLEKDPFKPDKETEDMYLVRYPVNQVDSSAYRYEIIASKYPVNVLAVKIDRNEQECTGGFFMVRHTVQDGNAMKLITVEDAQDLKQVTVGIDFGSTNTCAYYKSDNGTVPIPFSNRRLALVGFDNPPRSLAEKHELLFVSNEPPINKNGQVKSWLHKHDSLYVNKAKAGEALVGGVPVNETNITVKTINENEIITNAGVLCSNMKWLSDRAGIDDKTSFMREIWMQICADLFDKGYCPTKLYWSYPSAMGHTDVNKLRSIYNGLKETPIDGCMVRSVKSHTESEAICAYAIKQDVALNNNRLFVGIDIGGSTSDILIMGRDQSGADTVAKLYSQCSIRMAANHFFKAINASSRFRKALYNFHESGKTKVKVINIADIVNQDSSIYGRSPYYLNNIFDQLNGENEFLSFYNSLNGKVPFVFALPAYVSGILVFYAGMLTRKAVQSNKLEGINDVHLRYYGKGGRTFEWVYDVYDEDAKSFYARCFRAGFGDDKVKFSCDNFDENLSSASGSTSSENKSEVAIGLVNINNQISGIYEESDEYSSNTPKEFLSEVFGEKGFSYKDETGQVKPIDEMDIVDGLFYRNLQNPETFDNFFKFMDIYAKFLKDSGIMGDVTEVAELKNKKTKIENVAQFFDNDMEYRKYLEELRSSDDDNKPSYRMPMFIAEALYYLEKVLLPGVFKE